MAPPVGIGGRVRNAVMRALISVYDKSGILDFAHGLEELGIAIVATDGTYEFLQQNGITAQPVSSVTKAPDLPGDQVRSLDPSIFAAILADRSDEEHNATLATHGLEPIDIVVINLYPFVDVLSEKQTSVDHALQYVDVAESAMIRAGAKNWRHVTVLVDSDDYEDVLAELFRYRTTKEKTRHRLAAKAFAHTAAYDADVTAYFHDALGERFPEGFSVSLHKLQDLRYGENLHQQAALYSDTPRSRDLQPSATVANAEQIHGKELSFNNLLDVDAAWAIATDFAAPAAAIVKHTNPCGLGCGQDLAEAFAKAYAGDPSASYGGIVGVNRSVDGHTADEIVRSYFEAVIAPDFTPDALQILSRKKAIRLLRVRRTFDGPTQSAAWIPYTKLDFKRIDGGFLVQTRNVASDASATMQVVTKRQPTLEELTDLHFAWRSVRHVKSNGIVLAKKLAIVGVGAGQVNRVNAVDLACRMADQRARGSVLASDAQFPFPDGVERAAAEGITAIIQPGGSIRDREVIEVADRGGIAMIFTGLRHFKH
jgi:phosphoribosylaminoimidazolecarboxamide formyltransferase / IMP cyclohydrolase